MINLFDFTYCGDYNRQIQNLARMVPEKWSFSDTDDNGILKGYLEHTFKRLYEEQKVWEKKNYAIFNTGLFNYYYQPIYAYFIPNLVPDRQRWYLEGFFLLHKLSGRCAPDILSVYRCHLNRQNSTSQEQSVRDSVSAGYSSLSTYTQTNSTYLPPAL